jgi:hypothetical protein
MQPEPLASRSEVEAMLFAIADMNLTLKAILTLLEEEFGGEEELPEDDG